MCVCVCVCVCMYVHVHLRGNFAREVHLTMPALAAEYKPDIMHGCVTVGFCVAVVVVVVVSYCFPTFPGFNLTETTCEPSEL